MSMTAFRQSNFITPEHKSITYLLHLPTTNMDYG